ncbi:MAG: HD domain-containing protein [Dehalococcoidia bacterium]
MVGGFLRDAFLGRESHDVDLAVAGDPLSLGRQLADALGGHFVRLHEEHKAARIVLPPGGAVRSLDLLPLREAIETDLGQRDLTINAMAVPTEALAGEQEVSLIDPYGGRRDLAEGIVRMVRPDAFAADPLRLLRAVRLCAELDFTLDAQTAAVMAENAPLLSQAAPERQREELMRILATPRAAPGLRLADKLGLLGILLPEVAATKGEEQPKEHHWDVFDHSLETVAALDTLLGWEKPSDKRWARLWRELWQRMGEFPAVREHFWEEVCEGRTRTALLKLGALLHDIAKPETRTFEDDGRMRFFGHAQVGAVRAAAVAKRLRLSAAEVRQVGAMVKEHLRPLQIAQNGPPSRRALYRYFRDTGEAAIDVLFLSLADHLATVGPRLDWNDWRYHLDVVSFILAYRFQEGVTASPRLVTGHDLMEAFGLMPGPLVGRLLEAVQEAQATGEVATREQALALARRELERMEAKL